MRYKREFLVPYLRDVASVELIKAWCEQEQRAETQLLEDSVKKEKIKREQLDRDVAPAKIPEYRSERDRNQLNKPWICLAIAVAGSIAWWLLRRLLPWFILALWAIVLVNFYADLPQVFRNANEAEEQERTRRAQYDEKVREYEKKLREYKSRKPQRDKLAKEIEWEKRRQDALEKRLAFYKSKIQSAEKELISIYSANVIPSPYRNRHAAFYLYDYFSTSQEEDLDGIIKMFALEKTAAKLDKMITFQTQQIIKQQKMIEAQIIAREKSLENHRENMLALAKMEKNAEQREKYLKMISAHADISNYLHANQKWIVEIK